MKNILVVKSKKIIPFAYLATQICIAVSVNELELNLELHLALMILATVGYLFACIKDPGYVKTKAQQINQLKQSEAKSSPNKANDLIESPHSVELNEGKIKEAIEQKNIQLGLQSKIECQEHAQTVQNKSNLSNTMKQHCLLNNRDCIVQRQLGNALVINQAQEFKPYPQQLKHIKRWCRQCSHQQPLRVRHCLDCSSCVRSFDHHCPWINNCVGQKNKLFLIVFLILQLTQLLALSLQLGIAMMTTFYKQSLFLQVVLICLSLVILGVLSFQLFIVSLNLSTWQYLRWNRIEYLMPFQQKKLLSLFHQGFKTNIITFLKANLSTQPVDWQQHININTGGCVIAAKSSTERRLIIQAS